MGIELVIVILAALVILILGVLIFIAKTHRKVPQGKAIVRTGFGGSRVAYDTGIFVVPVLHRAEEMDISLKTIEVQRVGREGLVCKDNLRADIKVVFFVRVNKKVESILEVAQTIGCARASDQVTLNSLFDAKFSEALKTVGKQFDFVELYTVRDKFKAEILLTIGKDLNGYELDDCAIDYLEQTSLQELNEDNILDSEGIKKIIELTAIQKEKANFAQRELEKTLMKQNVEAREAILQLELQQKEKEERQKRAISELKSEQENAAAQINIEKSLATELQRKEAEAKGGIAEENKQREIIAARKNKERTEAVETERVETDRMLEVQRKERAVGEAQIDKEKVLEAKKRDIQMVIKERKAEERKTVVEDQEIQNTIQIAEAERAKKVTIIAAQQHAEEAVIKQTRQAEADKIAAEIRVQQMLTEAEGKKNASVKEAEARKIQAEALAAEEATVGLAEADVIRAKAEAKEKDGLVNILLLEKQALAEAKGTEARAEAERKKGLAEAEVLREKGQTEAHVLEAKASAEAQGIAKKAEAMKLLDGVGKEHEEFKLRLEQQRYIQIAEIEAKRQIAQAQAQVLAEALKQAKIDIVGGETQFFNQLTSAIAQGKSIDRLVDNSQHLLDVKTAMLGSGDENENFLARIKAFADRYGYSSETLRNLSMSVLMRELAKKARGTEDESPLKQLMDTVAQLGMGREPAAKLL